MGKSDKREGEVIKLTPELNEAMQAQLQAFRDKFGREPAGDDPIFFDPDGPSGPDASPIAMTTEKLNAQMLDAFYEAGTPERLIYAYKKTGLILTQENWDQYDEDMRDEFEEALEEFADHSSQIPGDEYAFVGIVEFYTTIKVASFSDTFRCRCLYKLTPDEPYFCPRAKKEMSGKGWWHFKFEVCDKEVSEDEGQAIWCEMPDTFFRQGKLKPDDDGDMVMHVGDIDNHIMELCEADAKRQSDAARAAHRTKTKRKP